MFGSSKKKAGADRGKSTKAGFMGSHNQVAKGTKIEGEVRCETDIRLDGSLIGLLIAKAKVVLGQTGLIDGDVICVDADVSGTIMGTLKVRGLLHLKSTAVITGTIKTKKLVIDPGAVFNGAISMKMEDNFIFELEGGAAKVHDQPNQQKASNDAKQSKENTKTPK